MKRNIVAFTGGMKGVDCPTGEALITKLSRAMNSGEPIEGGAVTMNTERKDGVLPQFDIRTDRFEVALEARDAIVAAHMARREAFHNKKEDKPAKEKANDGDAGTKSDVDTSSSATVETDN